MVALVETTEHQHIVGTTGLLDGLGYELLRLTIFRQVHVHLYIVIETGGVAHIATGKVDGAVGRLAEDDFAQSIEWGYLALHLERRRAAANGHGLNGILANYQNPLGATGIEGQQAPVVLQQHDAFLTDFAGSIVMGI